MNNAWFIMHVVALYGTAQMAISFSLGHRPFLRTKDMRATVVFVTLPMSNTEPVPLTRIYPPFRLLPPHSYKAVTNHKIPTLLVNFLV